jgi:hypothetical protein
MEMVEAIRQLIVIAGCWRAIVTLRESPSKIKEDNPNETAKRAARRNNGLTIKSRARWVNNRSALDYRTSRVSADCSLSRKSNSDSSIIVYLEKLLLLLLLLLLLWVLTIL